jgi:phosphatidylglycerol:prolipoprotein diacylglycerol transferase
MLSSLSSYSHPVHPTQIYESAACLAISAVCMLLVHPRKRYDGQVFLSFVALYAAARFVLEFWRDDDRGGFAHLSTSQLLGIALALAALGAHWVRGKRAPVAQPA